MKNLICPFCKLSLKSELSDNETYFHCEECLATIMTKSGKRVNYYRYNLKFNENDELISYTIYLKENEDDYIDLGSYNEFGVRSTYATKNNSLKSSYKSLGRVSEWYELDLNDPINSSQKIIKKVKLLSTFL